MSSPGKCVSHIDFSADPCPITATRKNRSIDYVGYYMDNDFFCIYSTFIHFLFLLLQVIISIVIAACRGCTC